MLALLDFPCRTLSLQPCVMIPMLASSMAHGLHYTRHARCFGLPWKANKLLLIKGSAEQSAAAAHVLPSW
jgi:hypothetical protein